MVESIESLLDNASGGENLKFHPAFPNLYVCDMLV